VDELQKIVGSLDNNLERIVLTRWGHALALICPNYFSKLNQLQHENTSGVYSLAHSSSKGLSRIETAVFAARKAVDQALGTR
jgi:hypothetical protein